MNDIPVHQLHQRTSTGLDIKHFKQGDIPKDVEALGAHRDDHYLFFLVEGGSASLMVDFNEVTFTEHSLFYILPGQVHHRIRNEMAEGWFIAVDTLHIAPDYRNVFESQLVQQQPYKLNPVELQQCKQLLCLLVDKYREDDQSAFYIPIVHSLLQSFLGLAAVCFSKVNDSGLQLSRPEQLSHRFKKLLVEQVRVMKSPSAYAARLNVSEPYLNEALKKVTGFSVSYWITQEVLLEAKRLLYYSELNVKEIAHALGYEDHAYFSRLFKKAANVTPLEFRTQYRK